MSYIPQDRELMESVHDFMSIVRWLNRWKWITGGIAGAVGAALLWTLATLWTVTKIPEQITRLENRLDKFDERLNKADVTIGKLDTLPGQMDKLDDLRVLLAGMKDFPSQFQRLSELPDELAKYGTLPDEMKDAQGAIRLAGDEIDKLKALPGVLDYIKQSAAQSADKLTTVAKSLEEHNKRLAALEESLNKNLPALIRGMQPTSTHLVQVKLSAPVREAPADGGMLFDFRIEGAVRFLASKHPGDLSVRNIELRSASGGDTAPDDLAIDAKVDGGALLVSVWTSDQDRFKKMLVAGGLNLAVQLAAAQQ